jgi:type VI secretion system protein
MSERHAGFRILTSLLLALVVLWSLSACGLGVRTRSLFGGKLEVKVVIDEKANRNHPVAVNVVLAYDEKLVPTLLGFSAQDWFQKRQQLKRDFPDGLEYWEWEWVPGQAVPVQKLPLLAKAVGAVVYADYLSPGEHRARIDPHTSIMLELRETDFTVNPI